MRHFNPLFPYGKRLYHSSKSTEARISIHSSHTGRDVLLFRLSRRSHSHFNPLFPYGKRPPSRRSRLYASTISIHSSHTGRDVMRVAHSLAPQNFNPLFPYGKRPAAGGKSHRAGGISIHSSHTGRDAREAPEPGPKEISIHSSHTGRDVMRVAHSLAPQNFNPLFPYGKRHERAWKYDWSGRFQSTLPIREETQ